MCWVADPDEYLTTMEEELFNETEAGSFRRMTSYLYTKIYQLHPKSALGAKFGYSSIHD